MIAEALVTLLIALVAALLLIGLDPFCYVDMCDQHQGWNLRSWVQRMYAALFGLAWLLLWNVLRWDALSYRAITFKAHVFLLAVMAWVDLLTLRGLSWQSFAPMMVISLGMQGRELLAIDRLWILIFAVAAVLFLMTNFAASGSIIGGGDLKGMTLLAFQAISLQDLVFTASAMLVCMTIFSLISLTLSRFEPHARSYPLMPAIALAPLMAHTFFASWITA